MGDASLSLVVLKTRQVDKLRSFYGALGVALVQEQHGTGPVHYAGQAGGVVLEVYPLPEGDSLADSSTRLGFTVANVVEVVASMQVIGAPIVSKPQQTEWGFRASVRDPDGRGVELCQR